MHDKRGELARDVRRDVVRVGVRRWVLAKRERVRGLHYGGALRAIVRDLHSASAWLPRVCRRNHVRF